MKTIPLHYFSFVLLLFLCTTGPHSDAFADEERCEYVPLRKLGENKATISSDGKQVVLYKPGGAGVIQETESGRELLRLPGPLNWPAVDRGWVFSTRDSQKRLFLDAISIQSGRGIYVSCSLAKKPYCANRHDVHGSAGEWLELKPEGEGAKLLSAGDLSNIFSVQPPLTFSLDEDVKRAIVYTEPLQDGGESISGETIQIVSLPDNNVLANINVGMPVDRVGFLSHNLVWVSGGDWRQTDAKLAIWDIDEKKRITLQDGYRFAGASRDWIFLLPTEVKPILIATTKTPDTYAALPGTIGKRGFLIAGDLFVVASYGDDDESAYFRLNEKRETAKIDGQISDRIYDENARWYVTNKGVVLDKQHLSAMCRAPVKMNEKFELDVSSDGQWIVVEVGGGNDKAGRSTLYHIIGPEKMAARRIEMQRRSSTLSAKKRSVAQQYFKKAFEMFQAGEFDAAIISFEKGLDVDPANAVAHFYLAETYARQNESFLAHRHYGLVRNFGGNSNEALLAKERLNEISIIAVSSPPLTNESSITVSPFIGKWQGEGKNSFGARQVWKLSFDPLPKNKLKVSGILTAYSFGNEIKKNIYHEGIITDGVLNWDERCYAKLETGDVMSLECRGFGSSHAELYRQ